MFLFLIFVMFISVEILDLLQVKRGFPMLPIYNMVCLKFHFLRCVHIFCKRMKRKKEKTNLRDMIKRMLK